MRVEAMEGSQIASRVHRVHEESSVLGGRVCCSFSWGPHESFDSDLRLLGDRAGGIEWKLVEDSGPKWGCLAEIMYMA